LAIARAAQREPDLPRAEHTHASLEVKLLVDDREELVAMRTQTQNRLRWHLHKLDPELDPAMGLDRTVELDRIAARLAELSARAVRRIAAELVADIGVLIVRINALEKKLAALVKAHTPELLELPGCGGLTGREDRPQDSQSRPVPRRGMLRDTRRRRPHPCLVGQDGQGPARPRRQPRSQRRAAPDRGHTGPPQRPRPRLLQRRLEALRALTRRLARVVFTLLKPPTAAAPARMQAAA
jgi:transposase